MSANASSSYNVFISYAPSDRAWVQKSLRPQLEDKGIRVGDSDDLFVPGDPFLENFQNAVQRTRRTILVLTPDWFESDNHRFLLLLLRTLDPDAAKRKLLPVVLKPCVLPKEITALKLETADFTDDRKWGRQYKRLENAIRDRIPPNEYEPTRGNRSWAYWRQWLRYYQRPLRKGALAVFLIWLLGSMVLQLPPFFQPRDIWLPLNMQARAAISLAYTGKTFVIGGSNPLPGCDQPDKGLWSGAEHDSQWTWTAYSGQILCFSDDNLGRVLAAIPRFDTSPANPRRIYAATSNVGLIRSDDEGIHWDKTGMNGLGSPKLVAVAADPENSDLVYVTTEGAGIYWSDDAGANWHRLDFQAEVSNSTQCPEGYVANRGTFAVEVSDTVLKALPHMLVAGTPKPSVLRDGTDLPGGLYLIKKGERCWRRIDAGGSRFSYHTLAYVNLSSQQYLLVLKRDWQSNGSALYLTRIDLSSPNLDSATMVVFDHGIDTLTVAGEHWYAADKQGAVIVGTLDAPSHVKNFPDVLACRVLICAMALANIPEAAYPALLATPCYFSVNCDRGSGRVFLLQRGSWWEGLYPYGVGPP